MDWDGYIQEVASLIENREGYQRRLGKLASELSRDYGLQGLSSLSEDLKEQQGLTISPSTLRNYRWVYESTERLGLPDDISYRTLQAIAGSSNPEKWAIEVEKGASSSDIYRRIMLEEKGKDITKNICPFCGKDISHAPKDKKDNPQKKS